MDFQERGCEDDPLSSLCALLHIHAAYQVARFGISLCDSVNVVSYTKQKNKYNSHSPLQ
jgi:hypothetical protein